ncbi:MAG: hypothetical protein QM487_02800 [Candidatus Marithrix sp.]
MMSNHINHQDIIGLTHIIDPRELCYARLDGLARDGTLFDYLMRDPVIRTNDMIYYPELTLTNNEKHYIVNRLINFKVLFLEKLEELQRKEQYEELYSLICPKVFILGFNNRVWLSRYDQFYESDSELEYIIDVVKLYNCIADDENMILYSCYVEYNEFVLNTDNKGAIFFFSEVDFAASDDFSMFLSDHYVDYHIDRDQYDQPRSQFDCLPDFDSYKPVKL